MRVSVVTPDKSFFDGEAGFVTVPALDGEIGVLPKHSPMIARLGHGIAQVKQGPGGVVLEKIAIYGGFLKIQDDAVTILAGGADVVGHSDAAAADQRLETARQELEAIKQRGADAAAELPEAEESLRRAQTFKTLFG